MNLFDKNPRIKNPREIRKILRKERVFSAEEKKLIGERAFRYARSAGGLSKEDWLKKVIRPLEQNSRIDIYKSSRLKKLAK